MGYCRLFDLLFGVFALAASSALAQAPAGPAPAPKRVLILYAERQELPAVRAVDAGMREAFAARGGVEVFTEYLDFSRFPAAQHTGGWLDFLRDRYATGQLDLVIAASREALAFTLAHREALFPGAPIAHCGVQQHELETMSLPAEVTGVALAYDFPRTVDLALQLQPDAREAVCVFGTSAFDRQVGEDALAALALHPQLRVRRMDSTPYPEVLEAVRHLPSESLVLYVAMMRDAQGQTRFPPQVAAELGAASSVPVYGVAANHLDRGLLGGAMLDYAAHGRAIGALAVALLNGEPKSPQNAASCPLLINWEALNKWRIPESRVPAEAQVRFKPLSLWQERRGTVIAIGLVVAVQAVLIGGLLVNRASRRRAERALAETTERMSLAAKAADLGMWIWDISADDAWMTKQGLALFGFKATERIDRAALLDCIHPEDRAAREAAIKRALETHGEYEMEYRVQMPGGGERWVSARGRCVRGVQGKGSKLLGVSMDVTARKQAELEAAQQRAHLGHLSRVALMGEMAASLAHELNQPLAGIVNNASAGRRFIARDRADFARLDELFEAVVADGKRAGEIIRAIRGMVQKDEAVRHPVDLQEVIDASVRLVTADALVRQCRLETKAAGRLPRVEANAVQLQQVLINLILNACEAMRDTPAAERCVRISAEAEDGGRVRVSVRDFGHGLPAEDPQRVFEQFFSTKHDGMGMGLAIARGMVNSHGGELCALNAEGGGACFYFSLPICKEDAA